MKKRFSGWQKTALVLAALLCIAGCSAGGGGGVNNTVHFMQQENDVEASWTLVFNDPDRAVSGFNKVLYGNDLLDTVEDDIYCGLGWAYANKRDYTNAIKYLTMVKNKFNDANLGLAACYTSLNTLEGYEKALSVLKAIGLEKTGGTYVSERNLPYTDADAHALAAVAYYFTGNPLAAVEHITYAKSVGKDSRYANAIYAAFVENMKIDEDPYFFRNITGN